MRADAAEPEVTIVAVAGEGGGYRILGRRNGDAWEFRIHGVDHTLTFIDEAEEPLVTRGEWLPTLALAAARLDPKPWTELIPREVHPDFRVAVLAEVSARVLAARAQGGFRGRTFDRWLRLCGVESAPTEDLE